MAHRALLDSSPAVRTAKSRAVSSWLALRLRGTDRRIPTEAQWEYACLGRPGSRQGPTTLYSWGDGPEEFPRHANLGSTAPQPVDSGLANRFGLHQMDGNISEWCRDLYAPDSYSQPPRPPDALRAGNGSDANYRCLRGARYTDSLEAAFSCFRGFESQAEKKAGIGVRPVIAVRRRD